MPSPAGSSASAAAGTMPWPSAAGNSQSRLRPRGSWNELKLARKLPDPPVHLSVVSASRGTSAMAPWLQVVLKNESSGTVTVAVKPPKAAPAASKVTTSLGCQRAKASGGDGEYLF